MKNFPDHPIIAEMERFGYISGRRCEEADEVIDYEEMKEGEEDD